MMTILSRLAPGLAATLLMIGVGMAPAAPAAAADKVRVSGFTDVNFGQLAVNGMDVSSSQNLCAYSGSQSGAYSVLASTGTGTQFALQSPSGLLAFDVQWADSANRATGRQLVANVAEGGFVSAANNHQCNNSPPTASLIVVLRANEVGSATAGSYSGQLSITIAPM